jgi:hypothetical protein
MNKEWMKDAFGTPLEEDDIVVIIKSRQSLTKRTVGGPSTEKSVRVIENVPVYDYKTKSMGKRDTKCYIRSSVALYEKGNKNAT